MKQLRRSEAERSAFMLEVLNNLYDRVKLTQTVEGLALREQIWISDQLGIASLAVPRWIFRAQ